LPVNNTDAEGRLTLADALVYAEKTAGATSIVDGRGGFTGLTRSPPTV
jgi:leucyl aminopeptidase